MKSRMRAVSTLLGVVQSKRESTIIICGHKGMGKSSVLDSVAQQLDNNPHRLLRASPTESTWPLSGLMSLLSAISVDEPTLIAEHLPQEGQLEVDCYAVALAIQKTIFDRLSAGSVILIDDADLLDQDSQRIIAFLASRLADTGVTFIGTISSLDSSGPWAAFNVINLEPLNESDALALAWDHAGAQADASVLAAAVQQSDGRPGTIIERVDDLTARELNGSAPLNLPLAPVQDTTDRLGKDFGGLKESHQRILQLSAMASLVESSAVISGAPEEVDALEDLVTSGRLERHGHHLELTCPLMRSFLYWRGSATERRELHRHLGQSTGSADLAAFHDSAADATRVPTTDLLTAGERLIAQGNIWMGIEITEHALKLGLQNDDARIALGSVAVALVNQMELEWAKRYLRFAQRQVENPQHTLDLAILDLRIQALTAVPLEGVKIESLLHKYRATEPIGCGLLLSVAAIAHCLRGEVHDAQNYLAVADMLLLNAPPERMEYNRQAHLMTAALEQRIEPILGSYHSSLKTPPDASNIEFMLTLGIALTRAGLHSEARNHLARMAPTEASSSTLIKHLVLLINAKNELRSDNFSESLSAVEKLMKAPGPSLFEPLPQIVQAWYWMAKDKPDLAIPFIESARPHVNSGQSARLALIEGEHALMRGHHEIAIEHLRRARQVFEGPTDSIFVRICANIIEALSAAERFAEATQEYRTVQSILATVPGRRSLLAVRRAQALALPAEVSVRQFKSLLDDWKSGDSHFEHARALHCYAGRLALVGHDELSREKYLAARTIFRSMGAVGWVQRVDAHLSTRPVQAARHPETMLSRDESLVVEMVHAGMTNKAIAAKLFISVSAVEARLSKLFKKTGATNRQQLAAYLAS